MLAKPKSLTTIGIIQLLLASGFIVWLLFFPNAPYMLTDLQDLARGAGGAPLWYDVIIVVWCSWTGMLLGVISLSLMHDIVQRTFGRLAGWIFVFGISALSSFGIYIGRFVRLNSWALAALDAPHFMQIFLFNNRLSASGNRVIGNRLGYR